MNVKTINNVLDYVGICMIDAHVYSYNNNDLILIDAHKWYPLQFIWGFPHDIIGDFPMASL